MDKTMKEWHDEAINMLNPALGHKGQIRAMARCQRRLAWLTKVLGDPRIAVFTGEALHLLAEADELEEKCLEEAINGCE